MYLQFLHRGNTKLAVEVYDNDGRLIHQRMVSRYSQRDVEWLATVAKWDIPSTNEQIQVFCEGEEEKAGYDFELSSDLLEQWTRSPVTPPTIPPFTIFVRELTQRKILARRIVNECPADALREAFMLGDTREPLIEWEDTKRLCVLDVDYHYKEPPTRDEIYSTVQKITPAPYCWHYSHGGGAKLFYVNQPGYTAEELAAVGGIEWLTYSPSATFDLGKSSRHPLQPRSLDGKPAPCTSVDDISFVYGSGDVSSLRRLLAQEIDPDDVNTFLESRGWTYGQALPHTECPINPFPYHKDCVFVGERGIFCHHCQAKGLGGKTPGFVSYSSLVRGVDNRLTNMVKNFVHLEQARIVLENLYPCVPPKVLETVYRVMLKIVHSADDPRIDMAMTAAKGFIRIKGLWTTVDGTTPLAEGAARLLTSLPAVLHPAEDTFKLNIPAITAFSNSGDLSEFGYYDVTYLRGCRIYGQKLPYSNGEVVKVVHRPEFERCPPTYLTESRRMPEEDAWRLLEQEFPGISRTYIKLLICAKGAAEGRLTQCPFLMITGVSKSGKSTSVHIAAGLCGDKADEPIFYPDVMRFRASLMDAARGSGFVCVNEIYKMARNARLSPVQALDPLLSLTEDSRSHVLYVGSVPFGRLPVFVLTDIECPPEVMQDYQLARRFTFFRLNSSTNWEETLIHRNIRPHEFRLISAEHALAADSILSYIIDEFFSVPTPLVHMASRLGIEVETSLSGDGETHELSERVDLKTCLLRLYDEVITAPLLSGTHAGRYNPSYGWKVIDRNTDTSLSQSWGEVCNGEEDWASSRLCAAEDWGKLLKLDFPVVLEVKPYQGGKRILYVRFRSADHARNPMWINGKMRNRDTES